MSKLHRVGGERRASFFYWALLRYPSTLVGGIRLGLLAAAIGVHLSETSDELRWWVVLLIGLNYLLDLLDGYLARRFGHTSRFGVALDFLIDQTTHTVFWLISGLLAAIPLMVLEWCAGIVVLRYTLCADEHWKEVLLAKGGALVRAYFAHNQRNVLSALGVISHFALPASSYLWLSGWSLWIWVPGVALYAWVTLLMLVMLYRAEIHSSAAS
jgi:phosphatidylglycerophosphate synthase